MAIGSAADIIWLYEGKNGKVMVMNKSKVSSVSETNIGIYVWELPEGIYLADGQGNVLSIASRRGDIQRMKKICQAAAHHGYPDGNPVFIEGVRKITDEEYHEQIRRMAAGETPDEYDLGALRDDLKYRQHYGD